MRVKLVLATATALTVPLFAATSGVGGMPADAGYGTRSGVPLVMPNGESYDHAAASTSAAASDLANEASRLPGFGGLRLRGSSAVEVYWNGEPPQPVLTEIQRMRSAGIEVSLREASYSAEMLNKIAQDLSTVPDPTVEGAALSAHASHDGSGILIGVVPGSGLAGYSPDALREFLDSPVPVAIEDEGGGGFVDGRDDLSRLNDAGQYDGGSRISNLGCTTGVAIYDNRNGGMGMLTAAHCGNTGDIARNNGNARGTINRRNTTRDIALIKGYSGGYGAWIHEGAYNGSSRRKTGILLTPANGMVGCSSGSYSGELCSIEVTATHLYVGGHGPFVRGTRRANTGTGGAAGRGDSGGPFVQWQWYEASGAWRGRPIGLVANGAPSTRLPDSQCQGVTTQCFRTVRFANLREATTPMEFNIAWVN